MIEPHGLTVAAAAKVLGVSRPALSMLLNGRPDLSGTMALRIEKAFGVRMETLMRMQSSYDIARARRREGEVAVERYRSTGDPGASRSEAATSTTVRAMRELDDGKGQRFDSAEELFRDLDI